MDVIASNWVEMTLTAKFFEQAKLRYLPKNKYNSHGADFEPFP